MGNGGDLGNHELWLVGSLVVKETGCQGMWIVGILLISITG